MAFSALSKIHFPEMPHVQPMGSAVPHCGAAGAGCVQHCPPNRGHMLPTPGHRNPIQVEKHIGLAGAFI